MNATVTTTAEVRYRIEVKASHLVKLLRLPEREGFDSVEYEILRVECSRSRRLQPQPRRRRRNNDPFADPFAEPPRKKKKREPEEDAAFFHIRATWKRNGKKPALETREISLELED